MLDHIKALFHKLIGLLPAPIVPKVKEPAAVEAVPVAIKKKTAPITRAAQKKAVDSIPTAPKRRGRPKKSTE